MPVEFFDADRTERLAKFLSGLDDLARTTHIRLRDGSRLTDCQVERKDGRAHYDPDLIGAIEVCGVENYAPHHALVIPSPQTYQEPF